MHPRTRHHRRRDRTKREGFALVTTVLLITLLIAITTELVTVTSTASITGKHRHQTLAHKLALDSAVLLVADGLQSSPDLTRQLDRHGVARATYRIGSGSSRVAGTHELATTAECDIRDDGAKLNPNVFGRPDQRVALKRKIAALAKLRSLPAAKVSLRPVLTKTTSSSDLRYVWFDQILSEVRPGALFRWEASGGEAPARAVWSDAITLWGDGRVSLRRVSPGVLEATLADVEPGLARRLLAARPADRSIDFMPAALTRVPAEIRQRVASRLTFDAQRYAMCINTAIGADRRRWYVVAQIADGNVAVLHRSQITW